MCVFFPHVFRTVSCAVKVFNLAIFAGRDVAGVSGTDKSCCSQIEFVFGMMYGGSEELF